MLKIKPQANVWSWSDNWHHLLIGFGSAPERIEKFKMR